MEVGYTGSMNTTLDLEKTLADALFNLDRRYVWLIGFATDGTTEARAVVEEFMRQNPEYRVIDSPFQLPLLAETLANVESVVVPEVQDIAAAVIIEGLGGTLVRLVREDQDTAAPEGHSPLAFMPRVTTVFVDAAVDSAVERVNQTHFRD